MKKKINESGWSIFMSFMLSLTVRWIHLHIQFSWAELGMGAEREVECSFLWEKNVDEDFFLVFFDEFGII